FLIPAGAVAQGSASIAAGSSGRVDAVVSAAAASFMSNPGKMGLSVGVLDHGQMYRYNYGEIAPGSGKAPTSATLYEIASISKTFTALILAHALAEHRMNLNDDIR